MRNLADDAVAHEAHRFQGARPIEGAHQMLIIPQVAAVAQNIFHHVADKSLVLLELTGKADELGVLLVGENRFCVFHQFRPGARWRYAIFLQEILSVVAQAGVDEKGAAEDLPAIVIGLDRRIEKLFLLR